MSALRRTLRWWVAAAALGGVVAGCSGSTPSKSATADTSGGASATTSVTNATGATTATGSAPTTGSNAQIGSGDFILADPRVGLDSLTSYRGTLTVSFDGTAAGQQVQWSSTSVLTRISDPASALLTIERTGDLDAADPDLVAEAAGSTFQRDAGGSCASSDLDPEASVLDALEPAAQLAGVVGGESIGGKDIDGAPASGYRFDQRAVGQDGAATTTGEVWMAVDGGYVIAYTMSATAGAELFGDGVEGTMSWEYSLTDVNASVTVDIPPECGAALLNAPLPADATNVVRFDTGLRFDTSSSPADVVAFYQQQSTAVGWVAEGEPSSDDKRGTVEFTAGDALITVVALATDAGSNVMIVSGAKPESAFERRTDWRGHGGHHRWTHGQRHLAVRARVQQSQRRHTDVHRSSQSAAGGFIPHHRDRRQHQLQRRLGDHHCGLGRVHLRRRPSGRDERSRHRDVHGRAGDRRRHRRRDDHVLDRQLTYRGSWAQRDSNPRPMPCKGSALTN